MGRRASLPPKGLKIDDVEDTYLNMTGLERESSLSISNNIGRFWEKGPHLSLCAVRYWKKGEMRLWVLEQRAATESM